MPRRTRSANKKPLVEGQRFGMLTALGPVPNSKPQEWMFLCDCGNTTFARPSHVQREKGTTSCGCKKASLNGLEKSPEYVYWSHVHRDRWPDFLDFWSELGPRPAEHMVVAPIDMDKPVGPRNAIWANGNAMFGLLEIQSFAGLAEMVSANKEIAALNQAAYDARKCPGMFDEHLTRIERQFMPKSDLLKQQEEMEHESMQYAKSHWLRAQKNLNEKGRTSQAEIGKEFLRLMVPLLALRLKENVNNGERGLRRSGAARHGSIFVNLLPMVRNVIDDHTIAYITISCAVDAVGRSGTAKTPMSKLFQTIGERIDHQVFLQSMKETDPQTFKKMEARFLSDETRTYQRKVYAVERSTAEDFPYEALSDEQRLHLGSWAMRCLQTATSWFTQVPLATDPKKPHKKTNFLCLTLEGMRQIDLIESAASEARFAIWPMVCPPLDWSPDERGGFLKGHPGGSGILIHGNRGTELSAETYQAINRMQSVPWRVNRLIYEIQKELLGTTNEIGAFKSYEKDSWMDEFMPRFDPSSWDDEEQAEKNRKALGVAHDSRVLAEKQRIIPQRIVETAARFINFEQIFLPVFVDARGRLYYMTDTLTPQGSDYQKALLEFAEGTPVTADNFQQIEREYLINLANTWDKQADGFDRKSSKLSFDDRVTWAREFVKDLEFVVDDPMLPESRKIWTSAEEPFLFLATLVEYWNVCVRKTQMTCHAPLALDATNSGSQILGGVLRNEKLCHFCNVTPSPDGLPQDMYGEVAKYAQGRWGSVWLDGEIERINSDRVKKAAKINKSKPEGEEPYVPKLDFSVSLKPEDLTRSVAKRPTMCSSYGASHGSKWSYVLEELEEAGFKDETAVGYVEGLAATNAIIRGQDDAFPILEEINLFFMTVGKICLAKGQEFVEWQTPTGNIIRQEYREPLTKQVRTHAMGGGNFHQFVPGQNERNAITVEVESEDSEEGVEKEYARYSLLVGYGDVIESKTSSALAANWTHSIDASVAVIALNSYSGPAGFIHDCLVAPPGRSFEFQHEIRKAYHYCVSAPVFDLLAHQNDTTFDEILSQIPEEKQFSFGNVDISECLNSPYLFS